MRLCHRLANRFILCPTTPPIEAPGLRPAEVEYSGGTLRAFVSRVEAGRVLGPDDFDEMSAPPELLVIKLPGTGGRAERSTPFPATLTPAASAEVWTWNPPGYGMSSGRATLRAIADAVLEFHDAVVARRAARETRRWVCGNSLGCATGMYLAARRPIDALVLRNPPPLVDLVERRDAWWNLWLGGRWVAQGITPEMDLMRTAPRVPCPALFIESAADRLVTADLQEQVRRSFAGPHRLLRLEGAAHDTPIHEQYRDHLVELCGWLWREGAYLRRASSIIDSTSGATSDEGNA